MGGPDREASRERAGAVRIQPVAGEGDAPFAEAAPLVSILIVNFNGAKWLPGCLDSLAKVSWPRVELVVVDNASADGSLRILEKYPSVTVVRNNRNTGFAGGNNLGLAHCRGSLVLLLNNDTIVPPDFLEPLVRHLQRHPEAAVAQGKMILPAHGNRLDVCGSFFTWLGLPYHYGYFKPDGAKYSQSYPVFSGKGACLMFRREIIDKIGGFLFDEDFFCYYEETDFCHRVWLAGYEAHFVPGPAVRHFMGGTAGDSQSGFVLRHYLRNMAFAHLGNLSLSSRMRILPVFFGALFASLAACLLTGKWRQAAAHWSALTDCAAARGKIRARRRLVASLRRRGDREIFDRVLRMPRLDYFVKTFRGKLSEYADEKIS